MSRLAGPLLALVALWIALDRARAEGGGCQFVERGYAYMKVTDRDEGWTYFLEASGPAWRSRPYGYHAPGWLM